MWYERHSCDMTTIVYTEEVMTSKSPTSGPRNVQTFTATLEIMGDAQSGSSGTRVTGSTTTTTTTRHRPGSPKPRKKFSVRARTDSKGSKSELDVQGHFPRGYSPHMFTITAYLPHDGMKRLKVSL